MSQAVDLKARILLDTKFNELGTLSGEYRMVSVEDVLTGQGEYSCYLKGEDEGNTPVEADAWLSAYLVKFKQTGITASRSAFSRKKFLYTIFVETLMSRGTYGIEALSGKIEEHFSNNEKLLDETDPLNPFLVTVIRTYQQPNLSKDENTSRRINRIYVECETFYDNQI